MEKVTEPMMAANAELGPGSIDGWGCPGQVAAEFGNFELTVVAHLPTVVAFTAFAEFRATDRFEKLAVAANPRIITTQATTD